MKAYWGSGCIDPHFHDLGTSWKWVVSFIPRPLYPRERAPSTHCIGGWVDPRGGLDDTEKWKFLTLPGLELRPLGRPSDFKLWNYILLINVIICSRKIISRCTVPVTPWRNFFSSFAFSNIEDDNSHYDTILRIFIAYIWSSSTCHACL
jgi:hypothetical protein